VKKRAVKTKALLACGVIVGPLFVVAFLFGCVSQKRSSVLKNDALPRRFRRWFTGPR
jgi:hypothetical protein